jgi:5-methylcytosine-specific restriction endonuclease McrA
VARATRRAVLKRDNYRCILCGATRNLEVHHIVPRAEGGSNDLANLVTLCTACHDTTHDRPQGPLKDVDRDSASPT